MKSRCLRCFDIQMLFVRLRLAVVPLLFNKFNMFDIYKVVSMESGRT